MSRIVVLTLCLLASLVRLHGQQSGELLEALRPPPAPTSEASAPGRPAPDPAAAELAALGALLQPLLERAEWPGDLWVWTYRHEDDLAEAEARNPLPGISARLARFERRFGVAPREALGWDAFRSILAQLHARMEAADAEHGGGMAVAELGAVKPPWLAARALLLELTDRRDDARALLLHEQDRWWWHCCPYDETEHLWFLAAERALQLDRAGETEHALRWYHGAWFWGTVDPMTADFGRHRVGLEEVLARYAELLADAGAWDAVRAVLAELERERPGFAAADAELQALAARLPEATGAAPQLFTKALVTTHDGRAESRAVLVGHPHDQVSWRVLGVHERLWRADVEASTYAREMRVLPLEDPRTVELLERLRPPTDDEG